jgi:hypothetical protein
MNHFNASAGQVQTGRLSASGWISIEVKPEIEVHIKYDITGPIFRSSVILS